MQEIRVLQMSIKRAVVASFVVFAAAGCGERSGPQTPALTGAALGERLYTQCGICHSPAPPDTAEGQIRLAGPNLWNIVGRPAGAVQGYAYSKAMLATDVIWDEPTLDQFLENPQMVVPGTRMSFAGEQDPVRRNAIIAYLKTLRPEPTDQNQD